MKFMRITALLLSLALVLAFASCAKPGTGEDTGKVTQKDPGKVTAAPDTEEDTDAETDEPIPEPEDVDLSVVEWTSANGPEGYEIRKNNNGSPVSLGNGSYSFDKSLVVVPGAGDAEASAVEIVYELTDTYFAFTTIAGVDDSSADGTVEFLVYADDTLAARTGAMAHGEFMYLQAEVFGCSEVRLVVTNADGDNAGDLAVWAAPTLFAGMDFTKYEATVPGKDVDFYIDELEWKSVACLHADTKNAPFIDKNEGGGMLSMGNGFFVAEKGVWMHPFLGDEAVSYAEIVIDLTTQKVSKFVGVFGLSDEYVATANGYGGIVDVTRRSVRVAFLVDGAEVESHDFVNSVKLGTTVIDLSGKSEFTIRLYNYDGTHTCDATVISGGFVA